MAKLARNRETGNEGRGRSPVTRAWRRYFWIVARPARGRPQVMGARLPGLGEAAATAMAVFSSEDEARVFLGPSRAGADAGAADASAEGGWAVRRAHPGELASVLLDPRRRTARVALDPLPGPAAGPVNVLLSMGSLDFLDSLSEDRAAV